MKKLKSFFTSSPQPKEGPNKSVFFYTFHKCASTLFATQVLNKSTSLSHKDIHAQAYENHKSEFNLSSSFVENGFVYGPIRIIAKGSSPVAKLLAPVLDPAFVLDKSCLFMIRDPRDILISSYFSFGFSHSFSANPDIKTRQLRTREKIQSQTIDHYALNNVNEIIEKFQLMNNLYNASSKSSILKYEDLINDYAVFSNKLQAFMIFNKETLQTLFDESRPKSVENLSSHHRSGQVEGFRKHLTVDTIKELNSQLSDILEQFNYPT
jgi:hypothetical protein